MRSDHISAWLVKLWLTQQAPHLLDGWDFEPEPMVKAMVEKIIQLIPSAPEGFTSQNVLARTAIELWDLQQVVLLGGGMPTPLSPRPEQIIYYTDTSDGVLADAAQLGYKTLKVDVTSSADLQQLRDARTVIATGLVHFLPDAAVTALFDRLAEVGMETVIFNHGNRNVTPEVIEPYNKLGFKLNFRSPDEIMALLPPEWQIAEVQHVPDVVAQAAEIGSLLADQPPMNDFYRVTRRA